MYIIIIVIVRYWYTFNILQPESLYQRFLNIWDKCTRISHGSWYSIWLNQRCRYTRENIIIKKNTVKEIYNLILYENIDQILPNKLHGPMHYKIGVTCVYNGHVFYTLL